MPARRRRASSAVSTFGGCSAALLVALVSEEAEAVTLVIFEAMVVSVAPSLQAKAGRRSLLR